MRERREDVERLLRLLDLLLLGQRVERAHVVEAVGQLDQDHPDVVGHRDHHLAVVLGLLLVAALERDAGELRDAVDELARSPRRTRSCTSSSDALVSSTVSCSSAAQIVSVSSRIARADLRDADRMGDEVLARLALLIGVALAREAERVGDACLGRPAARASSACSAITANRSIEQLALLVGKTRRELGVGGARRPAAPRSAPTRTCASAKLAPSSAPSAPFAATPPAAPGGSPSGVGAGLRPAFSGRVSSFRNRRPFFAACGHRRKRRSSAPARPALHW